MRVEKWLFGAGLPIFLAVALVYGFFTHWSEHVGLVALVVLSLMCGMVGLYLHLTSKKLDFRPEDDIAGEQASAEGDYGFFSPFSWWPLPLAAGAAVTFLGLAVGWWVFIVGVVFASLALVGWCFEYFRGENSI